MSKLTLLFFLALCLSSCAEPVHKTDGHMDVKLPKEYQDAEAVADTIDVIEKIEGS